MRRQGVIWSREEDLMTRWISAALLTAGLLAMTAWWSPAGADDAAVKNMQEAVEAYKNDRFGEAIDLLNMALGEIRKKQVGSMKNAFPPPLAGWKAEDTAGDFAGAALFGGGAGASRKYTKDDQTVEINIATATALVQPIAMMLSNPMIVSADPTASLVKIKGNRAIQKWNAEEKSGELSIVYKNTMLIRVEGSGLGDVQPVRQYAEGIALEKLDPFVP
jgi:hypothetical protein